MAWYVEMGGSYKINGEKHFGRKIYVLPEEVDSVRDRFNNEDVYCTAYRYEVENQDESNLIGSFYIDLDYEIKDSIDFAKVKRDLTLVVTSLETQFNIPRDYLRIYFSGHKGFHVIVPEKIYGAWPDKELNRYYKAIADRLKKLTLFKTVDTRIYDNKRLLRLPNSINGKTGLYKVPITLKRIMESTFESIQEYASKPQSVLFKPVKEIPKAVDSYRNFVDSFKRDEEDSKKGTKRTPGMKLLKLPPCMQAVLDNGAEKGKRNNTAVILANAFYQMGMSLDQAIDRMQTWNDEKNSPKLSKQEIVSVTTSGFREGTKNRRYGCSAIKDLDLCPADAKCKYKK